MEKALRMQGFLLGLVLTERETILGLLLQGS